MVAWTKVITNATNIISYMSNNQYDQENTHIAVSGNGLLRIYRFTDSIFKLQQQIKADKNILHHSWVNESRLVAATQDSKILIIDSGELVLEISYLVPSLDSNLSTPSINTIGTFSSGFLIGLNTGVGVLFEKTDDNYFYKKGKEFLLEDSEISSIAISPHEDSAIIALKNSQIYQVVFESDSKSNEVKVERLSHSFHTGSVLGMDVSISKPIFVTSGIDKSVRVYNYLENSIEVVKFFDEPAQSVALHPNGLYLLAGFHTSLKLMAILIDDIRPFWETAIRGCRCCEFSNGGQYFAAIWSSSAIIHNTWTLEMVGQLKSQGGKFKSVAWSTDDSKILTITTDGVLSQWNTSTLKKDYDMPSENGLAIAASFNLTSQLCYSILESGTLHELKNGVTTKEIHTKVPLALVMHSKLGSSMFAATSRGDLRVFKYPFAVESKDSSAEYIDLSYHSAPITHLKTSFDDQFLFTCGEDGCVWIYRLVDKDGHVARRDKDWTFSDEILVTKSDLRDNYRVMNELRERVDELKNESDAQLKLKDNFHGVKLKELTDKYTSEVELLKNIAGDLRKDAEESLHVRKLNMAKLIQDQVKEIQNEKKAFVEKLEAETSKYAELMAKTDVLQKQWEDQMDEMDRADKVKTQDANDYYKMKIDEKQTDIENAKAEFAKRKADYEAMIKDIEEDVEKETLDIVYHFELKLKEERKSLNTIRAENLLMKSKFEGLTKQIDEHKRDLAKSVVEEKKLHGIIKSLENDIVGVKREVKTHCTCDYSM